MDYQLIISKDINKNYLKFFENSNSIDFQNECIITFENLDKEIINIYNLIKLIITEQNSILSGSKILQKYADEIIFKTEQQNIMNEIIEHFEDNQNLDVKGFVDFKLKDITFKVDLLLYSAIKILIF